MQASNRYGRPTPVDAGLTRAPRCPQPGDVPKDHRPPVHVDLERTFADTSSDPDMLRYGLRDEERRGWFWLTGHHAVALLAEAGSGKTHELREFAAAGADRFLMRVEALCTGSVAAALDTAEQAVAFDGWLRSERECLLLVDAVDEAKLPRSRTAAPLRDALAALRRAIGDGLHRVRIVVTCRSSEWHDATEREPMLAFAAAMAAARRRHRNGRGGGDPAEDVDDDVIAVTFAPLTLTAIGRLGASRGAGDGFIEALRESGALDHAVTPLDVIHYADLHAAEIEQPVSGLTGTRRDLADASVSRRLAERDATWRRSDLRPDLARAGARLLCFALTMAQARDLAFPGGGAVGLDAAAVLASANLPWNERQVRELLSTALFVPSGQGLIRPYRPEVVAMLAAEHLDHLVAAGHPVQRIVSDFFHQSFDRRVVARAHGPMIAWLASMQGTVLRNLIDVAPELLIEDGDPRALALEDRVAALERHVAGADARLPGNFHFLEADLRRFAVPDLEAAVVRLLGDVGGGEGRFHLLQIVAAGRYAAAAPAVLQLCEDPQTPTGIRVYAMAALVACGTPGQLAECTRCLLAWGAPVFPVDAHRFAREREDDVRHRLARHAYPGAITADRFLSLLRQIRGKEWSVNAKPLAAAIAGAPAGDLGVLVTGLDRLCFPQGDGARPQAAPPVSKALPDLFRSLVVVAGRAMREREDLHADLVPIHGRCLRTFRFGRGHGYGPRERAGHLQDVPSSFRLAILDAYATGVVPGPWYRIVEHVHSAGVVDAERAQAEAAMLLQRYGQATATGRTIYADVLAGQIRSMPVTKGAWWRIRLWRAASSHRNGRDVETLRNMSWLLFAGPTAAVRRWRAELPWRIEHAWTVGRLVARERADDLFGLMRDLFRLRNGRAVGSLLRLLEAEGSDELLVLDPAAARRRRLGGMLVTGAKAHSRRHEPTRIPGDYVWYDILAFAGWGYAYVDDPESFLAMGDDDVERALVISLTSPLPWPVWGDRLASARPLVWIGVVRSTIFAEVVRNRAADPRSTPHALGRIADLDATLQASVAVDLVDLASGSWLPSRAEARSLRTIADADAGALDALRRLARRRTREAVWEGAPQRVPEWLSIWAAWDAAAVAELLRLREGPLSDAAGRSAMVRALDVLLSRETAEADRLVRLDTDTLRALASHLMISFPPEKDDGREGVRRRDERRVGEEVRGAVMNLLGERHDVDGRAALERFVEEHVVVRDGKWARVWLSLHSRDAAEPAPWTLADIASYGAGLTRMPHSADELLNAVVDGLRAIERDLASSEFDRRALFADASEAGVRAFLGHELDRRHRRHYAITQETVTAREKRTDLRCELRVPGGPVAVVEIKLLHGWTWTELLDKVVTQLLEQYLISDRVAHGAYVIVDVGRPPKGRPPAGGPTDAPGLVEALRTIVRTDARFDGRSVRVELLRIEVPPPVGRRARSRRNEGAKGGRGDRGNGASPIADEPAS